MSKLAGTCLCGKTGFDTKTPVKWCLHCHCESCRKNTGSGYTTFFGVADGTWNFVGQEPGIFSSTHGVTRYYCTSCGTPMAYRAEKFPDEIHFYLAHLKNSDAVVPTGHVHWSEKAPWVLIQDDLPKYPKGSGDSEPH